MTDQSTDAGLEHLLAALARREAERLTGREATWRTLLLLSQLDSAFIEIEALSPHIVGLKKLLIV